MRDVRPVGCPGTTDQLSAIFPSFHSKHPHYYHSEARCPIRRFDPAGYTVTTDQTTVISTTVPSSGAGGPVVARNTLLLAPFLRGVSPPFGASGTGAITSRYK